MEPLKNFFSLSLIDRLANDMTQVFPSFDQKRFVLEARKNLESLELMGRAQQISVALRKTLPSDYSQAIKILLRSLGPEHKTEELLGVGMAPFYYLPHVIFVADHGLEFFDLSMMAQYELTKRFTAEFSIRSYIAHNPEECFRYFETWIQDKNAHVRRLVSEGTRLRLPWAKRVEWLDQNPERILELLEQLKDDPTTLVRRSVANNLNDLGKLNSQLLIRTCEQWKRQGSVNRLKLIQHALRSEIKKGNPKALQILGVNSKANVAVRSVKFSPKTIPIGQSVIFSFTIENRSDKPQDILVDLAVYFMKPSGKKSKKIFKISRSIFNPHERRNLMKKISLGFHTTRTPFPGKHDVEILINGTPYPAGSFLVKILLKQLR